MSTKVGLIIGAYYHPPVSMRSGQLEEYYSKSLKVLISNFYTAKDFNLSLYLTGHFIEWLEQNHPEFFKVAIELVKAKRLEILGGGFSAPILPLISHKDRIEQIEGLNALVSKSFNKRPRGAWLARGIWEENLPVILHHCGIEYTFLPVEAFQRIGVEDPRSQYRVSLTEAQGKIISVIPYSPLLSRQIFLQADSTEFWRLVDMLYLSSTNHSFPCLGLILDGSLELSEANLLKFFSEVRNKFDSLEILLPSSMIKRHLGPFQHYFFPTAGYKEMSGSGAQFDPQEQERARSNYKQIFSASQGFNQLYAKMVYTSFLSWLVRGNKYRRKDALEELYLAQDHHFYFSWDGKSNLNTEFKSFVMEKLITAESKTREPTFVPSLTQIDFNLDGKNEYLYRGKVMNLVVCHRGAQIIDWDMVERKINLTWAPSLEKTEDRRYSFADYWGNFPTVDELANGTEPCWEKLWNKEFKLESISYEKYELSLQWKGLINARDTGQMVKIDKHFVFLDSEFQVKYTLQNLGPTLLEGFFGPELRLNIPENNSLERNDVTEHVLEYASRKGTLQILSDIPYKMIGSRAHRSLGDFYRLLFLQKVNLESGATLNFKLTFTRLKR